MEDENVHSCHSDQSLSDQSLSDLLQNAIETHTETSSNLCDILQRLLDCYPNCAEMSVNYNRTQNNLQRLEMEIEQSLNVDLYILLQTMINRRDQQLRQNSVQSGGTSESITRSSAPPAGNNDTEQPSTSRAEPPSDVARPSISATSNNYDPSPSDATEPSQINFDALIRHGGIVNGYYVTPRPRFNSVELRRTLNMCEIRSTDLTSYHILLHQKIEEIASFARRIGGDSSVINLTMNSKSLKSSVNAVLTPGNNYDINLFTEQIEKILQSDDQLLSDDSVEIEVDVAMNRQGGGHRRKLTDLPLQQVIKRKKMSLFVPLNCANNLCFSFCLVRFLEPQLPESELEIRRSRRP